MLPNHQIISLTTIPGMGPWRIRNLIKTFPDLDNISQLSSQDLNQIEGLNSDLVHQIVDLDPQVGHSILAKTEEMGAQYISYWSADFPALLRQADDAPVGIYIMGTIPHGPAIGVVGTRQPSSYGRRVTAELTRQLVTQGIVTISGFARGVDTLCHHTTLESGGKTIAILGSGLDVNYPAGNRVLRHDVIQNGGIISEFPPGIIPEAPNFPRRNRIISGLSLGIVVIEAGEQSGALNTAYHALHQNREVFAVPGEIYSKQSCGCHQLIQKGAKLVTGLSDILDELPIQEQPCQLDLLPDLSSKEEQVYQQMTREPIHVDQLCSQLDLPIKSVLPVLLTLELKKMVHQQPGQYYIRK